MDIDVGYNKYIWCVDVWRFFWEAAGSIKLGGQLTNIDLAPDGMLCIVSESGPYGGYAVYLEGGAPLTSRNNDTTVAVVVTWSMTATLNI